MAKQRIVDLKGGGALYHSNLRVAQQKRTNTFLHRAAVRRVDRSNSMVIPRLRRNKTLQNAKPRLFSALQQVLLIRENIVSSQHLGLVNVAVCLTCMQLTECGLVQVLHDHVHLSKRRRSVQISVRRKNLLVVIQLGQRIQSPSRHQKLLQHA